MTNSPRSGSSGGCGRRGRRRVLRGAAVFGVIVIAVFLFWSFSPQNPRIASVRVLERLDAAMGSGDTVAMMKVVVLPPSLARLTEPEQTRQVREALRGEVTREGLKRLTREGEFGRAIEIFPDEIIRWTAASGVNPTNCIAWRMGEVPLRAEVVLYPTKPPFRIVRCNNVFVRTETAQRCP